MDPIQQQYAPPEAPILPTPSRGEPLGWALLALPVAAGIAQAALPDTVGVIAAYGGLLATVVLIGVDADRRGQHPTKHIIGAVLLWLVFYPLYMHRRVAWGAPRRLGLALVATAIFLAGAFARPLFLGQTRAYVLCQATGAHIRDGFTCTIEHRNGSRPANVCWDLVLTCANGPAGSGHACGRVEPKQTSTVAMPYASFPAASDCDKLTKMQVDGLSLTDE
jgi:hypothetical protein